MNKVSGKLAAGVRKVRTQQKPAAVAEKPAPVVSRRGPVPERPDASVLHPARIWPD
ncbi:MAG: hypothetical protein AB1593_01910 [Pseudomonadota bacterium]